MGVEVTQARVDELEDMTPDQSGQRQVYIGDRPPCSGEHRAQHMVPRVKTSPGQRQTVMGLGRTKRISFVSAKSLGRTFKVWAAEHMMQECGEAAERFRALAATAVAGRRVGRPALEDAWREALSGLSDHDSQLLDRLAASSGGGVGGEGPEHRELKEFVMRTPSVVGLPPGAEVQSEYRLDSHDLVDVMFYWQGQMVAVEVKSVTSNVDDIRRGLFQCIKYKAVTEAMLQAIGKEPNVRSILVVGGSLPTKLRTIQMRLGVEVKENVRP